MTHTINWYCKAHTTNNSKLCKHKILNVSCPFILHEKQSLIFLSAVKHSKMVKVQHLSPELTVIEVSLQTQHEVKLKG